MSFINYRHVEGLAPDVKERLAGIAGSMPPSMKNRPTLLNIIQEASYDPVRGIYCPLNNSVKLNGMLPVPLTRLDVLDAQLPTFFSNLLVLPDRHGRADFVPGNAIQPSMRAANGGFVVATIEHDPKTFDRLNAVLRWTGKDGVLDKIDASLRKFKDYQGHAAVFSGRRSVHFHFIFSTRHLINAPYQQDWADRLRTQDYTAALMANAHDTYWKFVADMFPACADPDFKIDDTMNSIVKWRRCPGGVRITEAGKDFLGVGLGTEVSQIILSEKIRDGSRAPKGSTEWVIDPSFSLIRTSVRSPPQRMSTGNSVGNLGSGLIDLLARQCKSAWGNEYPKPVSGRQDQSGQFAFYFKNHAGDKTPSTIVKNTHTKLLIVGSGSAGENYELPGGLNANEIGSHLALRCGLLPGRNLVVSDSTDAKPLLQCSERMFAGVPWHKQYEIRCEKNFALRAGTIYSDEAKQTYREKMAGIIVRYQHEFDRLILSGEGIGKSYTLFFVLACEALDAAMNHKDGKQRFCGFAFKSLDQAREKAREFSDRMPLCTAFVWASFRKHYEEVCAELDEHPLAENVFDDEANINSLLRKIKEKHPQVFQTLEVRRKSLWAKDGRSTFNAGTTLLFTSHKAAQLWTVSHLTKTWHHPDFHPFDDSQDHNVLCEEVLLEHFVKDDVDSSDFFVKISGVMFDHLKSVEHTQSKWRNSSKATRRAQFNNDISLGNIPSCDFQDYDSYRRVNLDDFEQIIVDFDAIPFGWGNDADTMYKPQHGHRYYVAPASWFKGNSKRWTFVTTEHLAGVVIETAYRKMDCTLVRLDLDILPGVYPINVSLAYDERAAKRNKTALVGEVLSSNDLAFVLTDNMDATDRTMSLEKMKGNNDLTCNDIYTIPGALPVSLYVELNVLGQWVGRLDVIALHYADIINQAVGRNTGFRQKDGTRTVVVMTPRLGRLIVPELEKINHRITLDLTSEPMW